MAMETGAMHASALEGFLSDKQRFLEQYKGYGCGGWVEKHWQQEVGVRLGLGQHYLDHTGAGLYTNSQLEGVMKELTSAVFGNPHSRNPSSTRATQEVTAARAQVLQFFNADPEQYHVIWTKGATEGLKMVGEYFPWANSGANSSSSRSRASCATATSSSTSTSSSSHFIYTQANHKSVLGIGAYAKAAGAQLHCLGREQVQDWLAQPGSAAPGVAPPVASAPAAVAAAVGVPLSTCRKPSTPLKALRDGGRSLSTTLSECSSSGGVAASLFTDSSGFSSSIGSEGVWEGFSGGGSCADTGSPSHGGGSGGVAHHLLAFPAKDNYEGQLYPLSWIDQVHTKSDAANRYLVLLDAAAYVPTHPLDLSAVQPDFVVMSFYKMFGYPTGLGALLVRKEAARLLNKVYFGGGSVDYCTAEDAWHVLSEPPAGLEDGTLGYLSIAALKHGFALLDQLGGMEAIHAHVEALRQWTYQQLVALSHSNGAPLLKLFGRHADGPDHQGGIFQFQLLTPAGERVPSVLLAEAATAAGLHVRTGCNCNPGRCLANLGILPEEERARAAMGHKGPVLIVMRPRTPSTEPQPFSASCPGAAPVAAAAAAIMEEEEEEQEQAEQQVEELMPVPLPTGSVRASLGPLSTWEDCWALVRFLGSTFKDWSITSADIAAGEKLTRVVNEGEGQWVELRATISQRLSGCSSMTEDSCGFVYGDGI